MSKLEAFKGVSVGDILAGKYRVEKILGMGGMGVVVAATHLDLRELRAIKLIRPDAQSDQSVERFLREARAVVRLRSEHVAEVYDVGRLESGAPYIVMELLEGHDLSAMLKTRGPLPIDEAVLYVTQACHALAEAHAEGIVHRDLKPGNLFVTRRPDGTACVKVLDFGISKHTKPEDSDPEMTGAKDLMGSPLYMSPEQMRSARKVDARADVWALGAILYKLLTGRAPFHAPTVPEIFAATLGKPVRSPAHFRTQIPPALDAVILKCLDKQIHHRYATAAELGAALMPFGPWEPAATESGRASFLQLNRRKSIPPEVASMHPPGESKDTAFVTSMPHSGPRHTESGIPITGLARSNHLSKPTLGRASSSWSVPRAPVRAGWIAFVLVLSVSSALAGATIVAFVARMPLSPPAAGTREPANGTSEIRMPQAILVPTPAPPPAPVPQMSTSAVVQAPPPGPAITSTAVIKMKKPLPLAPSPRSGEGEKARVPSTGEEEKGRVQ